MTVRAREPTTATSTFTQLLSSAKRSCPRDWPCTVEMESRPGARGAQECHLDFHTALELCETFMSERLAVYCGDGEQTGGTGSPGMPPRLSHSS